MPELLRSLTIKLTRVEEAEPFFFHEAMNSEKQVSTVGDDAPVTEAKAPATAADEEAVEETKETTTKDNKDDVSETELDSSLEKITK